MYLQPYSRAPAPASTLPVWLCSLLLLSSFAGAASAQDARLPSWPQQFSVQGPEQRTFGFPVTQPGPIAVDIQVKGAPIVVVLQGPASQGVQQQGSGAIGLLATATPQDVQKGLTWIVSIRLAQPMPPQQGGIANGTITVKQPPADPAHVQAATNNFVSHTRKAQAQNDAISAQAGARLKARLDAALIEQQQQLGQWQAQRQAALARQAQPMVDQLRARAGNGVTSRALAPDKLSGPIADPALRERPPMKTLPPAPPPAPSPVITSLNVAQGQPGDTVLITGSNFGAARGEIHFLVAPGMDRLAPADFIWTDTQIFARVPDQRGIIGFNGVVSIKRPDQVASNLVPFTFIPLLERRLIVVPQDYTIQQITHVFTDVMKWGGDTIVNRGCLECFWAPWGSDRFFNNARLQNTWKVYMAPSAHMLDDGSQGGVTVTNMRVGSDSPYMEVSWWANLQFGCHSHIAYGISIPIEGPAGTADGFVVK